MTANRQKTIYHHVRLCCCSSATSLQENNMDRDNGSKPYAPLRIFPIFLIKFSKIYDKHRVLCCSSILRRLRGLKQPQHNYKLQNFNLYYSVSQSISQSASLKGSCPTLVTKCNKIIIYYLFWAHIQMSSNISSVIFVNG